VDEGGTQCGICTPGFIVSLCGFVLSDHPKTVENAINAVAGNICRCTGYKSIERAIGHIVTKLQGKDALPPLAWLIENEFLPSYFTGIQERLDAIKPKAQPEITENTVFVGGGTDLYVQRPAQMLPAEIVHLYNRTDLKGIWKDNGRCRIGASTTAEALKQSKIIKELSPKEIEAYFDLISSAQIRHMGTLAGNLVNASPIGDLTVFFLSLNSNLVLNDNGSLRELPLNQFYKGYKVLDKKDTEYIQELNFELPKSDTFYFNFEKVSKRTYLDIASTGSAMSLQCDANGKILKAGASAGGVAPVPFYLQKTVDFLEGKTVSVEVLSEALDIAQTEVAPISDVRGTAEYKKLLLRQLMLGHFIKFFPEMAKELLGQLTAV
ncbi:MAG: (2Fe-2S)-binding protein, partial [Aureispira sp.]|nr:(2Fe-2S)-binding protein [Aureispira sp.]